MLRNSPFRRGSHAWTTDRFYATVSRQSVDQPCTWLGIPDVGAHHGLFDYFDVANMHELIERLDDDIVSVEIPYRLPTASVIYAAFDFAKRGQIPREHRTLNAPGFFEGQRDPAAIDEFAWPDPSRYIDPQWERY